jgi:hypothetical protein
MLFINLYKMGRKISSKKVKISSSRKASSIHMRVPADLKDRFQAIAVQLGKRQRKQVTITTVVLRAIDYGLDLVERESAGYMLPKRKRMTEGERLLAVAEEACKIGFEYLRSMTLGQAASDTAEPEGTAK